MEGPGGVLASWHAWMIRTRESGDPRETRYLEAGIGGSRKIIWSGIILLPVDRCRWQV